MRDVLNRDASRRRQEQEMQRAIEQRNNRNRQGQNAAGNSASSNTGPGGAENSQSDRPLYSWMNESVYVTGPSTYSDKKCVKVLIQTEKACESGPALLERLASRYAQAMAQNNLHQSCEIAEETRVAAANTNADYDRKCKKFAKAAEKLCFIKKSKRHKRAKELKKLATQARAQAAIIATYRLGSSCQAETAAVSNCQTIEDLRTKPECRFSLCGGGFRDQPECRGGIYGETEVPPQFGGQGAPRPGSISSAPDVSPNPSGPAGGDTSSPPVLAPNGGTVAGPNSKDAVVGLSVQYGSDRIGVSVDSGFRMIGAAYIRLREKDAFLKIP